MIILSLVSSKGKNNSKIQTRALLSIKTSKSRLPNSEKQQKGGNKPSDKVSNRKTIFCKLQNYAKGQHIPSLFI